MASKKFTKAFWMLTGATISAVGYKMYRKRKKGGQKINITPPVYSAGAEDSVPPMASGTFAGSSVHGGGNFVNRSADMTQNILLCKGTVPLKDNGQINSNVLVFGGSGAEKNYRLTAPNLLQMDASYVITDPGGGLLRSYGKCLEHMGYRIKTLDLMHMEQSNHYNPFKYIRSDADIDNLAEACMTAVSEKYYADQSEYEAQLLFLQALIGYLHYYGTPEDRSFAGFAELIPMGIPEITEWLESPDKQTPLDGLFKKAAQEDPNGYAVRLYQRLCEQCDPEMRRHMLIYFAIGLMDLFIDETKALTATDDIGLDTISDRKTALFVIIPTAYKTFNILATMLYAQLFRCLEDFAENDAPKTVLVVNANNEVVRTFRPGTAANNATVREEAEAFLERAKGGQVGYDTDLELWTLKTAEGELVLWRGSRKEAEKAHALLRAGSVVSNQEHTGKGNCLPVRTRFFMDDIAELGRIPDFPAIVATLGKYGASLFLFVQTISIMQKIYPNEWDCVMNNCDILVYLGGDAEYSGAQYVSSALGQSAPANKSPSQRKRGSLFCKNKQLLLSVEDLRSMPAEKCLVCIRAHKGAYILDKYAPKEHPRWEFGRGFSAYTFDPSRSDILQ